MTHASSKTTIHASADAVWQVIVEFGAACKYIYGVVNCSVAGEGVGALRTLTCTDGSKVVERLEALDGDAYKMSYALLTDTPFRNCLITMVVRELSPSKVELEWSATFEADGLPASEAAELLECALAANSLAMKQFMEH